jgi:hypothetical protein
MMAKPPAQAAATPDVAMLQSAGNAPATQVTAGHGAAEPSADQAPTKVSARTQAATEVSAAQATADVTSTNATAPVTAAATTTACGGVGRDGGASQRRCHNDNCDGLHHGLSRFLHVSCPSV